MQYLLQPKRSDAVAHTTESRMLGVRRERQRTEIRESAGRRRQDRWHPRTGTVVSTESLPLAGRSGRCSSTAVGHKAGVAASEHVPMDLSMLGKGKQKGKGKCKHTQMSGSQKHLISFSQMRRIGELMGATNINTKLSPKTFPLA